MDSKTKIAGHALHPLLIVFPVVLYLSTFVALVVFATSHSWFWWQAALWSNVLGVAAALVAAVPGAIDLFGVAWKYDRARPVGLLHMALNLSALALFAGNLVAQQGAWAQMPSALRSLLRFVHVAKPDVALGLVLSGSGVAVTVVAGLLGWALVHEHRIGVDETRVGASNGGVAIDSPLPLPGTRT